MAEDAVLTGVLACCRPARLPYSATSEPAPRSVSEPGLVGEAAPRVPWDLAAIVSELRRACEGCEPSQSRAAGSELPSREALVEVVAQLRAALFPSHFGRAELRRDAVDYFVGHTLDTALRALLEQVRRELSCTRSAARASADAATLTAGFARRLPRIRLLLETDVRSALSGDPAALSRDEVVFCYPGISAVMHHRFAHALAELGAPLLARIIAELAHAQTGIDIHPGACIGSSFFIDHGTGVVIGETSIIGERVRIYQGVTLGAKSFPRDEHGALIRARARHPIIEDDVVIYAGATVLGRITIGRGSSVGGNVWVTSDVPPHSQVTQLKAPRARYRDGAGI